MKIASRPPASDQQETFKERLWSFYLNYMLFETVERARDLLTGFLQGAGITNASAIVESNHVSVSTDAEVIVLLSK